MVQSLEAGARIEGLVSRVQNGEREAFALLYQEYFERIYRYVYLRIGQVEQAEDLTQEVFLKALNSIGSYQYRGALFSSWLFRIAHNLIIDHYRKSKNNVILLAGSEIGGDQGDPVGTAERTIETAAIQKAIETLPPHQRQVLSLRFGAQMSVAETAKTMGKTDGTVKKLQFEALTKLRRLVGNEQKK